MTRGIIVDTGPLVSLPDRSDGHHTWASRQAEVLPVPWLVCEAVLTEAWHLLRNTTNGQAAVLDMLGDGVLRVAFNLASEADAVSRLVRKYADLPMSLADGCVVRMAELLAGARVVTLDRHFTVYRMHGDRSVPLVTRYDGPA